MSNENTSETMNDKGGVGKNDPKRTTEAPKGGQQSQGTTLRTDKGMPQQGGSDHKGGQQSQGDSQADDDGMKQAGSTNLANDPKSAADARQRSGAPK